MTKKDTREPVIIIVLFPYNMCLFSIINKHFKRLLIKVQESCPKAFKMAKTPELLGALPPGPFWGVAPEPHQGTLKQAPGPHAMIAHVSLSNSIFV